LLLQVLDDAKTLADSGFTQQTAKAQAPALLKLAFRDGGLYPFSLVCCVQKRFYHEPTFGWKRSTYHNASAAHSATPPSLKKKKHVPANQVDNV